jgi:hypothetical protein
LVAEIISGNRIKASIKDTNGNDPSPTGPLYSAFPSSGVLSGKIIAGAVSFTMTQPATMGVPTAGTPFRIWKLIFDNGDGTFSPGFINCSSSSATSCLIFPLDESGVASTTADAGTCNSAGVIYSTNAISNKPFRIVGFMQWSSGLAVNGVYDVLPDIVQLYGPGCKKPGDVVQQRATATNARSAFSTANIPADDTIPQNTEGVNPLNLSITPKSPVNILKHQLSLTVVVDTDAITAVAGLFQDSNADALCTSAKYMPKAFLIDVLMLKYFMQALTVSSIAFKIRAGKSEAVATGAGFATNGVTTFCAFYGQKLQSSYEITEYMG